MAFDEEPGRDIHDECRHEIDRLTAKAAKLRTALVGLVGLSSKSELERMEAVLRMAPAPMEDKAAAIDAIHALIATMEE